MRIRLLGPVDVVVDGVAREVPGLRLTAVLATLALQPGQTVSVDRLADVVWGDDPPTNPQATLHNHVSRLRTVLGDRTAILTRAPGYQLDLGKEATDVQAAHRLIDLADRSTDPTVRERHLREAVALWRGRPLTELADLPWFDDHARQLEQLQLTARIKLLDAGLALGHHEQLVAELEGLATTHPVNEDIHAQLMLALYRTGRQSDALAAFRRLRHTLATDLGVDPSQRLRDLETAILRHDVALVPTPRPRRPSPLAPAQLPSAVAGFVGRIRELSQLDGLLSDTEPPAAVVISAIAGTAGIGKTALAVHWAHRVAGRFPDGQLYVNLRGFDPNGQPVDPGWALHGLLEALGVTGDRIPSDLDSRVGLYRSLLAGKRVLVVLDNAGDTEQVRPLLPATPGCSAIVTSRNRLAGLVAVDGAHPVTLDLLSIVEAQELLADRLGTDRLAREPEAVDEIVARSARLPLALVVAAARAEAAPSLAAIAAQLRDSAATLDALGGEDPTVDIRAVFSWSYRALTPDGARLFRLLGVHPGADIGRAAVASLAGVPPAAVGPLLAELTGAHLITEHSPGRYAFHDLLRAFANDQVGAVEPDPEGHAAILRLLDHYLHTAHAASHLLASRRPITLAPARPGVHPEELDDEAGALEWFAAEQSVLAAAVERAAADRLDTHTWQLAWTIRPFLVRRGLFHLEVTLNRLALDAARHLGDRVAEARTLQGLGLGYTRTGRLEDAETTYRDALALYLGLDDRSGQAVVHTSLSELAERAGRYTDALTHAERAVELYRELGDREWYPNALNSFGYSHALVGDFDQALVHCEQALRLLEESGDEAGQAFTWDSLGYAHRGRADHPRAAACYERSAELFRRLGGIL